MDILGRYYTENKFSQLLVSNLKQRKPKSILDLGVGEGALIQAAYNRWLSATFYAADIDKKKINSTNKKLPFVDIIYANGLSSNIDRRLNVNIGSIDVAICNPPYLKIQNELKYKSLFEEASLNECLKLSNLTSDLIFLAQNLKFLKTKGELGIILPDTLVTGHNFELLRKSLVLNHKITSIIQLPDNVFRKTEARTHILILEKGLKCSDNIPLYKANTLGQYENQITVKSESVINRMDFDYHFWEQNKNIKNEKFFTLSDLNVDIKRGSLTHKDLKENYRTFFHTTDFKYLKTKKISKIELRKKTGHISAKKGDILLSRVGKRCIGKVAIVKEGEFLISDCIYRIRVAKKYQNKIFYALLSEDGQEWLKINAHGVCAQVISKSDLLKFPI